MHDSVKIEFLHMLKKIFNHSHYNEIIIERNAYIYTKKEKEKLTIKSKLAKRLSRKDMEKIQRKIANAMHEWMLLVKSLIIQMLKFYSHTWKLRCVKGIIKINKNMLHATSLQVYLVE